MKLFSFEKLKKNVTLVSQNISDEGLVVGGTRCLAMVTAGVRASSLISEPGSKENWVEPGWLPL